MWKKNVYLELKGCFCSLPCCHRYELNCSSGFFLCGSWYLHSESLKQQRDYTLTNISRLHQLHYLRTNIKQVTKNTIYFPKNKTKQIYKLLRMFLYKFTCSLCYPIIYIKDSIKIPLLRRVTQVNDSLKFTSSDTQICWNFLLKKCE